MYLHHRIANFLASLDWIDPPLWLWLSLRAREVLSSGGLKTVGGVVWEQLVAFDVSLGGRFHLELGKRGMYYAQPDSSFLLENLFETQRVKRMKSKGRKPEMKLLRCVAVSLNLSLLPLAALLNFAPFDEKSSRLGKMRRFGSWVKGWKENFARYSLIWFWFALL